MTAVVQYCITPLTQFSDADFGEICSILCTILRISNSAIAAVSIVSVVAGWFSVRNLSEQSSIVRGWQAGRVIMRGTYYGLLASDT